MPKLKFIEASGAEHDIEAETGSSVMEAAMSNGVPGIVAECGGFANCATCHAYIDGAWESKLPPPEQTEKDMLECAFDIRPNSRLTCQIQVTPELDGLVVRLPSAQIGG